MNITKKIALFLCILLLTLPLFSKGAKEIKSDERLYKIESISSDEFGPIISCINESGDDVIIRIDENETKLLGSVERLNQGDIIAVKDNGIMTMSLPPQTTALSIRNVTPLVKTGIIKVTFEASKTALPGSNEVLDFAKVDENNTLSVFNYCYGYYVMDTFISNGVTVNGAYFARGVNDAYSYFESSKESFFYSFEEMSTFVDKFGEEYVNQGKTASVGTLVTKLQELTSLAKPTTLEEEFSYSYGVFTTLDLLSYGYDIIAPEYIQGALTCLYGFTPKYSEVEIMDVLNNYIESKNEEYAKYFEEIAALNAEASKNFLEEQSKVPGVKKLDSGVLIEIISEDSELGATPTNTDSVIVNYTLRLLDGTIADQGNNAMFQLSSLIPGFVDAVTEMKVGQTIIAYIPPELGYGQDGAGTIPPNSLLIFEIDLLGVFNYIEEENVEN